MKPPRELLRRVITKTITPTELVSEIRLLAPQSAGNDQSHPWWKDEGDELLDILIMASSGNFHLNAADAVVEARRVHGRVLVEKVSGVVLFRVLSVAEAEVVVTEKIVAQAMPAEMVEPTWDDVLPTFDTFRRLAEKRYLARLITKHEWNVSTAATEADIARQTLHGLLERHGLRRPGRPHEGDQIPLVSPTLLDVEGIPA